MRPPTLARVRLQRLSHNREPQKSTAEGRKCGQLFSVEREGSRYEVFWLSPARGLL